MKNPKIQKINFEDGQILPIVILVIFALIGFMALMLDGGALMSNRRSAQAAADAGALAGASRICMGANDSEQVAINFATNKNEATNALAVISGGEIKITATIQQTSFFANIFGEDSLTTTAQAVAGCYHPSTTMRVFPMAFYYQTPPIKANSADCSDPNQPCALINWDFYELLETLKNTHSTNLPLDNIYIISDKTKICDKPVSGPIVCNEMVESTSGGNRSWIDLSVLGDSNLKKVIKDGLNAPLVLPAWLNGQPGTISALYDESLYEDLEMIEGSGYPGVGVAVVPVYDQYCASNPAVNCAEPGDNFFLANSNQQSYRLVGIAPFIVTCVTKSGNCVFGTCIPANLPPNDTNKDICPAFLVSNAAAENNNAIEGYFADGIPTDSFIGGTGGVDAGLSFISLSE